MTALLEKSWFSFSINNSYENALMSPFSSGSEKESRPFLGHAVLGSLESAMDTSYAARHVHGTVYRLLQAPSPISSQALGLSSPLEAVPGMIATFESGSKLAEALGKCSRIKSAATRSFAYIRCLFCSTAIAAFLRDFTITVAGILYLPGRFLAIEGMAVATVLLKTATGLFVGTFILLAITEAIEAYKAYKLKEEIKELLQGKTDTGAYQTCLQKLKEKMKTDRESVSHVVGSELALEIEHASLATAETLIKSAEVAAAKRLKAALITCTLSILSAGVRAASFITTSGVIDIVACVIAVFWVIYSTKHAYTSLEHYEAGRFDKTYLGFTTAWLFGAAVLAFIIGEDLASKLVAIGTGSAIQAIQWSVIYKVSKKHFSIEKVDSAIKKKHFHAAKTAIEKLDERTKKTLIAEVLEENEKVRRFRPHTAWKESSAEDFLKAHPEDALVQTAVARTFAAAAA